MNPWGRKIIDQGRRKACTRMEPQEKVRPQVKDLSVFHKSGIRNSRLRYGRNDMPHLQALYRNEEGEVVGLMTGLDERKERNARKTTARNGRDK